MSGNSFLFEDLTTFAGTWCAAHLAVTKRETIDGQALRQALRQRLPNVGNDGLDRKEIERTLENVAIFWERSRTSKAISKSASSHNTRLFWPVARAAVRWTKPRMGRTGLRPDQIEALSSFLEDEIRRVVLGLGLDAKKMRAQGVYSRVMRFCTEMRPKIPITRPERIGGREDVRRRLKGRIDGIVGFRAKGRDGKSGPLSVSEVHDLVGNMAVTHADGSKGSHRPSRAVVARGLAEYNGMPVREARISSMGPAARDVLVLIEMRIPAGLPRGRVSVVRLDEIVQKMVAGAAPSPQAMSNRRAAVRAALAEIDAARIGVHADVSGRGEKAHAVIGRGRNFDRHTMGKLVDEATQKGHVRTLHIGLVSTRHGLWGTELGRAAIAACRVASTDEEPAYQDLRDLFGIGLSLEEYEVGNTEALNVCLRLYNLVGAAAMWRAILGLPHMQKRLWTEPSALFRRQAGLILAVFEEADERGLTWEEAVNADLIASRPGRKPRVSAGIRRVPREPARLPTVSYRAPARCTWAVDAERHGHLDADWAVRDALCAGGGDPHRLTVADPAAAREALMRLAEELPDKLGQTDRATGGLVRRGLRMAAMASHDNPADYVTLIFDAMTGVRSTREIGDRLRRLHDAGGWYVPFEGTDVDRTPA